MKHLLTLYFLTACFAFAVTDPTQNMTQSKATKAVNDSIVIPSGKSITIDAGASITNNGTATGFSATAETLTGTTLNSTVVNSSLTSLGTITIGTWHGTAIADSYISSAATWNAKESALTFSTGLTRTVNTITVNATQVISALSNLTTNGIVTTTGGNGTLSVVTVIPLANGGTNATDAAGARTSLGLGSISTQSSSNVSITGGSVAASTVKLIDNAGGSISFGSQFMTTNRTLLFQLDPSIDSTVILKGGFSSTSASGGFLNLSTPTNANVTFKAGSYNVITDTDTGTITNAMLAGSIDLTTKVTGVLPIANGGTGQSSASAAINALVPSQTGHGGEALVTDGSAVNWGSIGKVKQIVFAKKTDAASSSTTTWASSGFTATITPTSSSSKIMVIFVGGVGGQTNYLSAYKMTRNGTDIGVGDSAGSRTPAAFGGSGFNGSQVISASIMVSDAPATTSATTYRLDWITETGSLACINRSYSDSNVYYYVRGVSYIWLIEYE